MLTNCVNCEFYVRPDDEFCLNCGIESPTKEFSKPSIKVIPLTKMSQSKFVKVIFSLFLTFFFLYTIADWDISKILYLQDYILILTLILGFGLSFLSTSLLTKWCLNQLNPQRQKKPENFSSRKKMVEKRLSDLDKRRHKIDNLLDNIKETDNQNLQELRAKLLSAHKIIVSQFARYELQAKKIELLRLQNGVSPYLFDLYRLNEFETENGLAVIETKRQEINKIRQNLTNYAAIEFPERVSPEEQDFLSQLDETETSCKKLREVLLSKQAARALQEISPIKESLKLLSAKEIIHAAETFNIQTTLTDFSESFNELEREYRLLITEDEIEQKFLEH